MSPAESGEASKTRSPIGRFLESRTPLTRILLVYSLIRVVLFLLVFAVVWALPINDIVRIAIALVVSGLLSYPLARRQRAELSERLDERRKARAAVGR